MHCGARKGELCEVPKELEIVDEEVTRLVCGRDETRANVGREGASPEVVGICWSSVDAAHAHARRVVGAFARSCRVCHFEEVCGAGRKRSYEGAPIVEFVESAGGEGDAATVGDEGVL